MLKEAKTDIIKTSQKWLETFIINLQLCPFARGPHKNGTIRWVVEGAPDNKKMMQAFMDEAELLLEKDPKELETTLLILPPLGKMEHFMAYFRYCEETIKYNELTDTISLVPFHPSLRHHGIPKDAPNHFTSISPYPMVHLLRKVSVDKLGAAYKGDVQADNDKTLRRIGRSKLMEMWRKMLED